MKMCDMTHSYVRVRSRTNSCVHYNFLDPQSPQHIIYFLPLFDFLALGGGEVSRFRFFSSSCCFLSSCAAHSCDDDMCMYARTQTNTQTDRRIPHTHPQTHARVRQSVSRSPCKTLQDTASDCYKRRTSISSESIPSEESSSSDPSSLSSACVYASVLQCVAVLSGVLQCVAEIFLSPIINILCVCVCGIVAVCCTAFEFVAVCCRALHENARPYVLL